MPATSKALEEQASTQRLEVKLRPPCPLVNMQSQVYKTGSEAQMAPTGARQRPSTEAACTRPGKVHAQTSVVRAKSTASLDRMEACVWSKALSQKRMLRQSKSSPDMSQMRLPLTCVEALSEHVAEATSKPRDAQVVASKRAQKRSGLKLRFATQTKCPCCPTAAPVPSAKMPAASQGHCQLKP